MAWALDLGPMHFGSDGTGLRPQMKLAYADNNCSLRAGIDDVRDGLSAGVGASMRRIYNSEGGSFEEVLQKLKAQSEIRVLDDLARLAPQLMAQIMHITGVDIPPNSHVAARVILKLGIGVSGGVCLGWADTKGYNMLGVQGSVSAAARVGADIMAGLHYTRKRVKAVLGISNVCVEAVFELPEPARTGTAGTAGEETPVAEEANKAAEEAARAEAAEPPAKVGAGATPGQAGVESAGADAMEDALQGDAGGGAAL